MEGKSKISVEPLISCSAMKYASLKFAMTPGVSLSLISYSPFGKSDSPMPFYYFPSSFSFHSSNQYSCAFISLSSLFSDFPLGTLFPSQRSARFEFVRLCGLSKLFLTVL